MGGQISHILICARRMSFPRYIDWSRILSKCYTRDTIAVCLLGAIHFFTTVPLLHFAISAVVLVLLFEITKVLLSPNTMPSQTNIQNARSVHFHGPQAQQSNHKVEQLNSLMSTETSKRILSWLFVVCVLSLIQFDDLLKLNETSTVPNETSDPPIVCSTERRSRYNFKHCNYIGVRDTTETDWKIDWDIAKSDMTELDSGLLDNMVDQCKRHKLRSCTHNIVVQEYFYDGVSGPYKRLVEEAYEKYTKPCSDEDEQAKTAQIESEIWTRNMILIGSFFTLALVVYSSYRFFDTDVFDFCILWVAWLCGRIWIAFYSMGQWCRDGCAAIHQAIIGWINARRDARQRLSVTPLVQQRTESAEPPEPPDSAWFEAWFERFKMLHFSQQKVIVKVVYGCAPGTKKGIHQLIQNAEPQNLQRMSDVAKEREYIC